MKKPPVLLPLIACFLVTVIFSVHFVIAKEVLQGHHPLALTTLRGLIAGLIIFTIFKRYFNYKQLLEHKVKLFFIGFFGFFANQLLFMSGLKLTTPLNASIITNAVPLVTATLAVFMGLESAGWKKFVGIIIGFISVLYIMLSGSSDVDIYWQGDLLVFLNMFVFAIGILLIKDVTNKGVHFTMVTASMMCVGGLLSLLVAGSDTLELLSWSFSSTRASWMMIFEVLISTVVAYILNFYALKHLAPSKITIFIYLQPIITAITSLYLYGQLPVIQSWIAFIGIGIGGLLVLKFKERELTSKLGQ